MPRYIWGLTLVLLSLSPLAYAGKSRSAASPQQPDANAELFRTIERLEAEVMLDREYGRMGDEELEKAYQELLQERRQLIDNVRALDRSDPAAQSQLQGYVQQLKDLNVRIHALRARLDEIDDVKSRMEEAEKEKTPEQEKAPGCVEEDDQGCA